MFETKNLPRYAIILGVILVVTAFSNNIKSAFISEDILVEDIDYYYSNVISRASTTMTQCRNEKLNLNKTGTEG